MNSIGSKTHFIFMSTNFASAIIICMSRAYSVRFFLARHLTLHAGFLYPETSGRSLEDMEALFNKDFQPRPSFEGAERYHDEERETDATLPRTTVSQS
jgi:hypothetical protein